ncbi:heme iron utilization protein [Zavarzinia aquatilis]|uniref:Heme iron utilization protein n=2 Tax=Zavarzinia aquatilis TaxID=2211142 RepID=A0A317EFG2_9PROT|nr:heme iron utilization protein [Zavarzinia aquatilis]
MARDLVRRTPTASLGVLLPDGGPYVSLVLAAVDHAGRPLIFISGLAEHTKALLAEPRASLLFDGTAGHLARLTGARVSLVGRMVRIDDEGLKDRFIARHAEAQMYRDFPDFSLWRMEPERAHLVAGFGRIHWIPAAEFLFDDRPCVALAEDEAGIVGHMNADHADAVGLYATALLGLPAAEWRMTGLDPEGADLMAPDGTRGRIFFDRVIGNATEARVALVDLVRRARNSENPV